MQKTNKIACLDAATLRAHYRYDHIDTFCTDHIHREAIALVMDGTLQHARFTMPMEGPVMLDFRVLNGWMLLVDVHCVASERYAAEMASLFDGHSRRFLAKIYAQSDECMLLRAVQIFYGIAACACVTLRSATIPAQSLQVMPQKTCIDTLCFDKTVFVDGWSSLRGFFDSCARIGNLEFYSVTFTACSGTLLAAALDASSVGKMSFFRCDMGDSIREIVESARHSVTDLSFWYCPRGERLLEVVADCLHLFRAPLALTLVANGEFAAGRLMRALARPNAVHALNVCATSGGAQKDDDVRAALAMLAANNTLQRFNMPMCMTGLWREFVDALTAMDSRGTMCSFTTIDMRDAPPCVSCMWKVGHHQQRMSDSLLMGFTRQRLDQRHAHETHAVICTSSADVDAIPREARQRFVKHVVLNKVPLGSLDELVGALPETLLSLSIYTCGGDIFA